MFLHLVVDGFSVGHLVREDCRGVREKADGKCRRIENLSVAKSFVRAVRMHYATGRWACNSCGPQAVGEGEVLKMSCMYALNVQHQLRMQCFFSPVRLTINLSSVFFKWILCVIIRISKYSPSFTFSLIAAVIHPGYGFSGFKQYQCTKTLSASNASN